MKYRLLGNSGLRVSEIALGSLNFGEQKAWGVDREEALRVLSTFAEAGGTLIDSAPNYAKGAAEEIIGAFIADRRHEVVVSTKYTASSDPHVLAGGNSARTMVASVEASLKRLGTDHIDLLWLHFWDGTTPLDEILKGFDALLSAGKIRYTGFSDVPAWLVSRAATMSEFRGWARPAAVQVEYSLAAREAEREFIPMAAALDLGIVGWGAMAAGALSGGANPQRRPADKVPGAVRANVDAAREIAEEAGLSLPEAALRWLLRDGQAAPVVPLIGARDAAQLSETLASADGPLDPEVAARLTKATAPRLGFPHDLIGSPYLQRFAFGKDNEMHPFRPRA
ncbi:aldo/keto reductase [Gymnodinialimonas ceratoperidinii]|uniref:Aldo/keto reductase n=1 Tax=Gymnodinialimonas ceratoperidinii TaxID=2856823 RepID=A0A8F6Y8S9_9RHOB|nr:aldo/keto reductase [Gymnodinialimonas ceratoperidinii]QXT38229.1 aldo/keto reductase [Gymnodinialimonas ceratoperidinii]